MSGLYKIANSDTKYGIKELASCWVIYFCPVADLCTTILRKYQQQTTFNTLSVQVLITPAKCVQESDELLHNIHNI